MMNETINKFYRTIKRHPLLTISIAFLLYFGNKLIEMSLDILSKKEGYLGIELIAAGFFIFLGIVFGIFSYLSVKQLVIEPRKRKKLQARPFTEPLNGRYKGLVVFISMIRKEPTPEKIREMIDSIKDHKDEEEMDELYKIIGIGQAIRAINHHLGELVCCWLLYTEASRKGMELVEYFIKKFGSSTSVEAKSIEIVNINKIEEVSKKVDDIYRKDLEEHSLVQSDVIVDVTGGNSLVGAAFTLACISPERDMEYVEQDTYNLIKIEENIPEVIFKR